MSLVLLVLRERKANNIAVYQGRGSISWSSGRVLSNWLSRLGDITQSKIALDLTGIEVDADGLKLLHLATLHIGLRGGNLKLFNPSTKVAETLQFGIRNGLCLDVHISEAAAMASFETTTASE